MPEPAYSEQAQTDAELPQITRGATTGADESVDSDELLSIMSDDHAQNILEMISQDALPARELANRLNISRSTVYRRLNRLEKIGVVEAAVAYNHDGHHRKRFYATLDRVVLSIDSDGIGVDHATESTADPISETPTSAR